MYSLCLFNTCLLLYEIIILKNNLNLNALSIEQTIQTIAMWCLFKFNFLTSVTESTAIW